MARHLNRPGTPGQQKKSLEAERSWSVMWWLQYVGRDRMLPVNPARLRSAENDANGKGLRTWVLNDFRVAAISAAAPALRAVELTYEAACVCATVTSQVRGFPDCHGTKVSPSGRLPSDLNKPTGSLVAGMPADTKALVTTSFGVWCLAMRPGASLHVKPWSPRASTWEPQWKHGRRFLFNIGGTIHRRTVP